MNYHKFSISALLLSFFIITTNAYAKDNDIMIKEIIDPPEAAALNIMLDTLGSLKALKSHNMSNFENAVALIKHKLVPNVSVDAAAKFALKKHWSKLNDSQKDILKKYLLQSLVNDYASIIASTNSNLDNMRIIANKDVKRKDNKAIVGLTIITGKNIDPVLVSVRMVRKDSWKIYDLVVSGVSLMTSYRANFDNKIKRKGIEALVARVAKKLK